MILNVVSTDFTVRESNCVTPSHTRSAFLSAEPLRASATRALGEAVLTSSVGA